MKVRAARFYMTDDEIRQDYLAAKNKKHQLEILADRNLVNKTVMRNKLVELGLIDGKPEPTPEESAVSAAMARIDEPVARALIEKDVKDEQIAARFGVGISTFRLWRRSRGIMRDSTNKKAASAGEQRNATPAGTAGDAVSDSDTVRGMPVVDFATAKMCLGMIAGVAHGYEPEDAAILKRAALELESILDRVMWG